MVDRLLFFVVIIVIVVVTYYINIMSRGKTHHLSLLYDHIVIQKLLLNLESFQNRFCQSIKMHKCMCSMPPDSGEVQFAVRVQVCNQCRLFILHS